MILNAAGVFDGSENSSGVHLRELGALRRILGVDRDLSHFYRAVQGIHWPVA